MTAGAIDTVLLFATLYSASKESFGSGQQQSCTCGLLWSAARIASCLAATAKAGSDTSGRKPASLGSSNGTSLRLVRCRLALGQDSPYAI